ncbi:hypothetical protein Tco_0454137 [Tanacetum coccineum]
MIVVMYSTLEHVISNRPSNKTVDSDSWYCRRGGKRSEEVGMLQNVHRNLVDWVFFVDLLRASRYSCFSDIGTTSKMRGKICSSVRVGGATAGACSIGALTSAIISAQSHSQNDGHTDRRC